MKLLYLIMILLFIAVSSLMLVNLIIDLIEKINKKTQNKELIKELDRGTPKKKRRLKNPFRKKVK